jgi:hypothetical protein
MFIQKKQIRLGAHQKQAYLDNRIPADFEYNGRMYEGIDSAFTRLHFHQSLDQWGYPMEYYKKASMP